MFHLESNATIIDLPAGQFSILSMALDRPLVLRGRGKATRIYCEPGHHRNWLFSTKDVDIADCVIDASAIQPAAFHRVATVRVDGANAMFRNVVFRGGPTFDVRVIGNRDGKSSRVMIENCEFEDGTNSQDTFCCCVRCHDNVDLTIVNSRFDGPESLPGRAGIVHQQKRSHESDTRGSVMVSNCSFRNIGFDDRHTYGAIDAYSGIDHVRIANNSIVDAKGRGICVKADASDATVTGNTITGLHGKHATACIAMYG
ncbi:MAG: hypothetical protein AAFP69_22675, partial [Planctomycetota bacterium]